MFPTTSKTVSMNNDKKFSQLLQVKKVRKRLSSKDHRNEGQDKFREQNSSDYFMLREYFLLFGLLRLIGINVEENAKNKTNKDSQDHKTRSIKERIVHFFENCLKYFVFGTMYSRNLFAVVPIMFLKDIKVDLIRVFQSLLFTTFYTCIYRKRHTMLRISKDIGYIYKQLPNCICKEKKCFFTGVLVFEITALVCRLVLFYGMPSNRDNYQNRVFELCQETGAPPMVTAKLLFVVESLSFIIAIIALSVFVTYYSLTCSFVRDVFKCLLVQMHRFESSNDFKMLHSTYECIMKKLNYMDSEFSFLAFVTILINTSSLFWDVYRLAFYKNTASGYVLYTLSGIFFLVLLLQLMISGCASNELANEVRVLIQCLPRKSVENEQNINFFKKTLLQDNGLTLWKIYVMDRSLVISLFGTLLSYGILLGTLGKTNYD
ncbi:uncharacterized protein TNIN_373641 [Trichonephila inaurata madagascariensis]|uniref:Gustatory receptor n=1 Tax=Trichonephila inaurata madagascariensis TaxID=2747483 RepID=A0A8X7C0G1_9ARAC|nr:uncharacterized protein TNIN_373641 [Trichonephila inaurata madagascariensis]